jgi:hypothetical protein
MHIWSLTNQNNPVVISINKPHKLENLMICLMNGISIPLLSNFLVHVLFLMSTHEGERARDKEIEEVTTRDVRFQYGSKSINWSSTGTSTGGIGGN